MQSSAQARTAHASAQDQAQVMCVERALREHDALQYVQPACADSAETRCPHALTLRALAL